MSGAQETQGLGLQSFYDVIQRVGEERGLMDPDAEEQVCIQSAHLRFPQKLMGWQASVAV